MKKLICMVLALVLTACCLPSLAATYYLQDMETFAEGLAEYREYFDKETHGQNYYKVDVSNMPLVVENYCAMLMQDPTFQYIGARRHGNHVYQCFSMAKSGTGVDEFAVHYYGTELTPDCVVALQYQLDNGTIYLRYSKDLTVGDKGYRLSAPDYESPYTPVPTVAPTLVPISTPVPVWRSCTECEGRGVLGTSGTIQCPVCAGKGYVTSIQTGSGFSSGAGFVYVPGYGWTTTAPGVAPTVTPRPGYWGGDCTQCGGDGHVTCYCCGGTGMLGCSGCGGDGSVSN